MKKNRNRDNILDALRKYFSGEQSEVGKRIYQEWFDLFDDSKGVFDELDNDQIKAHTDLVYDNIQGDLNKKKLRRSFPLHHTARKKKQKTGMFILAAILVVGCTLSLIGIYFTGVFLPNEEVVNIIEKSNPRGQISEFKLPDGSSVWLNVDSKLTYSEKFSGERRELTLEGEAYFDVVQDISSPFIVHSGSLSTRALGTSFNIKAYPADQVQEVTLISGKVEVLEKERENIQILKPNQKIRYEDQKGLQKPMTTEALLATVWTKRELVFLRENLGAIAKTFERWYGVEFVFEDEDLMKEIFVYHFKDLSLKNSMIILKELSDFEYEIIDNKVIVKTSL